MFSPPALRGGRRTAPFSQSDSRASRLPAAAQAAPVLLGTTSPVRRAGRLHRHQHRPFGASTAISASRPARHSSASACPPSSTAPRTPPTPSPRKAQLDLTTAYNVAAGQPVSPANDLTGTDLGNRTLKAGAYRFTSSAQLTGPLTLDAEGDPKAQFVFEIASALTTASASSVVLLNGANPCNVYWQVGSSATLGTTTAFQGNLMALSSISLEQRRHGDRPPARPQRRGHADQQRARQQPLQHRIHARPVRYRTGTAPARPVPARRPPRLRRRCSRRRRTRPATRSARPRATARRASSARRTRPAPPGSAARCTASSSSASSSRLDGKRIKSHAKGPFLVFVRAMPGAHHVTRA